MTANDPASQNDARRRGTLPLGLLLAEYALLSIYLPLRLSRGLLQQFPYIDQIIFEQAMLSFLRGNGLAAPFEIVNQFALDHGAVHFQPILYLLAPLYGVHPHFITIKTIEIILVCSSVIPLSLLARRMFRSPWAGWLAGTVFLLDWSLHYKMLFDFRPVNLVIPIYFWCLFFLQKKMDTAAVLMASLALSTRETEVFTVCLLGIFVWKILGRRRTGLWLMALSVFWCVLSFGVIIPMFNPETGYMFVSMVYSELGGSLPGALNHMIENPMVFFDHLFTPANGVFLNGTLLKHLYLPLLSLTRLLPAIPAALIICLSLNDYHKSVFGHYASPMVPFIYLALLVSWQKIRCFVTERRPASARWILRSAAAVFLIYTAYLSIGYYRSLQYSTDQFPVVRNIPRALIDELKSLIPETDTIAADARFAPYFLYSHPQMYQYPGGEHAEWLAFQYEPDTLDFKQRPAVSNLHARFNAGYLPMGDRWRSGLFVMSRKNIDSGDFLAALRRETVCGFDMTTSGDSLFENMMSGISFREPDGTWSDGDRTAIPFCVPRSWYHPVTASAGEPLLSDAARIASGDTPDSTGLEVMVTGHHPVQYCPDQSMTVALNGRVIARIPLKNPRSRLRIQLPGAALRSGINLLEFRFAETFQPCALDLNEDCRELAFKFISIEFTHSVR